MKLSVFRGGFTVEAATDVAGANVRLLRRIVGKALISALPGGRYDSHELLRQFAHEHLIKSGQADETRMRHATYFVDFVRSKFWDMYNYEVNAIHAINEEFDNIVYAWDKFLDIENTHNVGWAIISMAQYCQFTGRNFDGIELLKRFVNVLEERYKRGELDEDGLWLYGVVLTQYGTLHTGVHPAYAKILCYRAIKVLSQIPETLELGLAYEALGAWYTDKNIHANHKRLLKAREIFERLDVKEALINVLHELAYVELALDHLDKGLELAKQALALSEAIQDRGIGLIESKFTLANLLTLKKEHDEAIQLYDEIMPVFVRMRRLYQISRCHDALAYILIEQDEIEKAKRLKSKDIRYHRELGQDWQIIGLLNGIANYFMADVKFPVERIVEVQSFVMHHPFSARMHRERAREHIEYLSEELAKDKLEQAIEKGRGYTLLTLLDELEAEFHGEL